MNKCKECWKEVNPFSPNPFYCSKQCEESNWITTSSGDEMVNRLKEMFWMSK